MKEILAVDIGGTGIKAGLAADDGSVSHIVTVPTEAFKGFDAVKLNLYKAIESVLECCGNPAAIAVSSAGDIDSELGKVVYATQNLPGFTGYEICRDLKDRFAANAFAINDGYAALIGERAFGAAKLSDNCVMLTVGTGVGGAAISGGKLVTGAHSRALRIAHITLYPGGRLCTCGGRGCAEQYISASALVNEVKKIIPAVRNLKDVFSEFYNADLKNVFNGYFEDFKIFTDGICAVFDPEKIIIGGGFSYFYQFWKPYIKCENVEVCCADLKNEAGMVGAAQFVREKLLCK